MESIRSCYKLSQSKNDLTQAIKSKDAEIKHWKDENGKVHAVINKVQGSIATMKALHDLQLKQIQSELNIKPKQITQVITVGSTNTGIVQTKVDTVYKYLNDTIKIPDYLTTKYAEKWIQFHAKMKDGLMAAEYSMKDSLQIVGYWKHKGFLKLGSKDYFIDVSSFNPNVTITNLKNFHVTSKPSNVGIGIIGGYGVGLKNPELSPFIGVGVFYRLF